jgi:hypothetical protein
MISDHKTIYPQAQVAQAEAGQPRTHQRAGDKNGEMSKTG